MRNFFILLLLFYFVPALGQNNNKLQLTFQFQPELTFHQNQYSYRWKDKHIKSTFNVGFTSTVQYNLSNRLFLDFGLGYISRRLNTTVFLNQAKLPPPYYSETKELNTTNYLSYRTLQIPASIGYYVVKREKVNAFLIAGITANYLMNAKYDGVFAKYNATYKKGYWQGLTLNGGVGADFRLSNTIIWTNSITYSLINNVKPDTFLFSQDEDVIPLPHTYLRVSTGIKLPL